MGQLSQAGDPGWEEKVPGEQREHQAALLPRAAGQGVTLQHLLEQGHR